MGVWLSYRLRLQRKRWRIRAFRKRRELTRIADRTGTIRPNDILLFSTQRNEKIRLPYFLDYYREQGVNHFFIVDNDSTDGSADYLADQPDVSVWRTKASYKKSRFGVDWLNWLMIKHAHGHWCLTVDPDEFLIYPFCDTRPLRALDAHPYQQGQNPIEIAGWFDSGNYTMSRNRLFGNLWIQGGPRARVFFADQPENAPALNKVPLVKWDKRYAYVSSTHMLLPRGLNQVYDEWGGEKASGVLLHAKFLDTFTSKAAEELSRGQHYSASVEYKAYAESLKDDPDLWCKWSEKYINWRQLEILGLMSKGNWA